MTDLVKAPAHYLALGVTCPGCGGVIECKRVSRHMSSMLGQALQYLWRADFKGRPIEDLEKAIECIREEIAMRTEAR
jgi:hypothetical protein